MNLIPQTIDLYRFCQFLIVFLKNDVWSVISFLGKNGILHDSQYRFHEKNGLNMPFRIQLIKLNLTMDRKLYLHIAFDMVDHSLLLKKLNHFGIMESLMIGLLQL